MTRLKRQIDPRPRGIVPNTNNTNKKVYCPLCQPQLDVRMEYNDIKQSWLCPCCGHHAFPKLSQITLSKSELKASNDFYFNRQKVFYGSDKERKHRRIDAFPIAQLYNRNRTYQSLMEANEASNIHETEE
jgi:rubredoxin